MSKFPPQYNSQAVIKAAEEKLEEEGVNAAQKVFHSRLLEWLDDVTMGDMGDNIGSTREEIANLWLAYADFNRRSNLNKSATEVYEQATNCSVVGEMGKIWAAYALFLEERGRPRTAQKLYLRALVGEGGESGAGAITNDPCVKDPRDQAMLWNGFLRMMQSLRKCPELTLEALKKAVQKEHLGQSDTSNDDAADQAGEIKDAAPDHHGSLCKNEGPKTEAEVVRPAKRSRWDQKAPVETDAISAIRIDSAAGVLVATSKNMPTEIETLWHARDGGSLPTRPEPPLFTSSPPKLRDPSGKDLIGNETALKILKMITAKAHDGKSLGAALLDLCHACWLMTALKEEESSRAQESLEKKIIADREAMEVDLDARASVAGGALAAVQRANEKERSSFITQSEAQREQLLSSSAWEFRKLLFMQQIILTSAKLPGFDGPTVESATIAFQSRVCSVMHSAFFLRARVGGTEHVNMLNKELESLEKLIHTVVAMKNEPTEQSQYHAPLQVQQQPMQYQQPTMPSFNHQQLMYAGQPHPQPMMGFIPMGYQAMPVGFQPPMMQSHGLQAMQSHGLQAMQPHLQQAMQPHQFMGQLSRHTQSGQQNLS